MLELKEVIRKANLDPTAIALENVLYWLLKNIRCLAQLRVDIDAVVGAVDIIKVPESVERSPLSSRLSRRGFLTCAFFGHRTSQVTQR